MKSVMCNKCVHKSLCERHGFISVMDSCSDFFAIKELQAWYVKAIAAKLIEHYGKEVYYERYHKNILRILKELMESQE